METIEVNGVFYSRDELIDLIGADVLEEPYDVAAIQDAIADANAESDPMSDYLAAAIVLAVLSGVANRRRGMVYSLRDQKYYRDGRVILETHIRPDIVEVQQRKAIRYQRLMNALINGQISLEDWELAMGRDIMRSHLRMMQVGAGAGGSARRLSREHLQQLRSRLFGDGDFVGELEALARFAEQLRSGEMTLAQALNRAAQYAGNLRPSYEEARHLGYVAAGWFARRDLDPYANHCKHCPKYSTGGKYRPADQVVPVGVDCDCRGRCRCEVRYRLVELSDRLSA